MREIEFCRLDGTTSLEDREEQLTDFVDAQSKQQVFLISTRAGGLGINLYTANHVIIYDSDWNPQIDLQAMDRAHRIGQTKKVYVYRLITTSTVEEKIIERQAIKLKLDQVIIQKGSAAVNSNLTKEEYEKILMHGAAAIFQMKSDKVDSEKIIDIDLLIKEGEEKFRKNMEAAANQVDKIQKDSNFNFDLGQIDCLQF